MDKIRIFALGGLDEDGKNCYVIDVNDQWFVIEAGLKYPDGEQLGVEVVIPDFTYLLENKDITFSSFKGTFKKSVSVKLSIIFIIVGTSWPRISSFKIVEDMAL